MNIPKPFSTMRRVIRANQQSYTVTRSTTSVTDIGGRDETTTTHEVGLWVQRQFEFNEMTDFGEVLSGDLYAVALPDEDITEGDRISHGNSTYEVETALGHPSDDNKQYVIISFTNMRN